MTDIYFEDMTPGRVFELGSCEMSEDEIIAFAQRFDPQPFHVDPEAAKDTPFRGLIASGWHTCATWMRLYADEVLSRADSRGSPGMEDLRWLAPVRPGDVLTGRIEVLEATPSSRYSDRGTALILNTMTNQDGVVVMRCRGRGLFGRRQPVATEDQASRSPDAPTTVHTLPSTNGVQLALRDLGGDGPNLLICHATGFHGGAYSPMAGALTPNFRAWSIDFRGHGSSTEPDDGDYAWRGMGEDALAAVDMIRATSSAAVYGFGHSMGGAALLLAEVDRPGMLAGLFLYEPIVFDPVFLESRTENVLAIAARKRREIFNSKAEALSRYASRPPLNGFRADALHAYVDDGFVDMADGRVRLACSAEAEARTFECDTKMTFDRVGGVATPTVVARGLRAEQPNPSDFALGLVDAIQDSELLDYEGLGHFGPFESPDLVATDVTSILRE